MAPKDEAKTKGLFGEPVLLAPELPEPGDAIPIFKETLPAGKVLYRCHALTWPGNSFNPGRELTGNDYGARFSPFKDIQGRLVPSLYAADSITGALAETLFHDLIGGERRGFLSIRPWRHWGMSQLVLRLEMTLVTLKTADLYRMGLSKQFFLLSDRLVYPQTQRWARAIHDQNPAIDGMVWKSRQHDDSSAFLFYGDRTRPEDLALLREACGIFSTPEVVEEIVKMADRLGIVLSDE